MIRELRNQGSLFYLLVYQLALDVKVADFVIEKMGKLLDLLEVLFEDVSVIHLSVLCPLIKLLVLYLILLGKLFLMPELDSFELQHLCC